MAIFEFDPNKIHSGPYIKHDEESTIHFISHLDMNCVELMLPGCDRSFKISIAGAEDLIENLQINTEFARLFASFKKEESC